ncbi:cip1-interacting zinc finger protein [Bombina bombina]|uniref:cip1-interacting zinc finger protein n=1 Tax=Bombina bombina TaxID=8345 RepID=UPI00235ABE9E|nr:cip1-interacting zinc finger protein [Bombina bombina]
MFNQSQQFHQLMQLQHLLQQQQQQQQHPAAHHQAAHHPAAHHHTLPRVMPAPVQHQPPQQMMNFHAANPARLLNTHPMVQRALLMQHMQGNLRGMSVAAPPMPHFFPAAARQSILGTPPMGVTVKPPRMGFPGMPFPQAHRMYQKDHYRGYDRKRESEQSNAIKSTGTSDQKLDKGEAELPPSASEADEIGSCSGDSENLTERSNSDPLEPSAKRVRSNSQTAAAEDDTPVGENTEEEEGAGERSVKSEHPEGVSAGRALKVTIQQRSNSRTISTAALNPAQTGPRFFCYICKTNCNSLQNFQSHLVTARHHQLFQEIQHLSNACLVTLLPTAKDNQLPAIGKDGKKKPFRWCNVCQIHFSTDLIKHRRTPEHKMAKRSLRPFCTVCSRHFKTPRKFVEHMKSPEHKQKSLEVRMGDKETLIPEDSEELITVDAVGCFEDEEDDDDEDEEEGISEDDSSGDTGWMQTEGKEMNASDYEQCNKYSVDTAYGLDFVVPVAGYLCRLCHKFYHNDSAARLSHCKSLMHFQNVQRYQAAKNRAATQQEITSHTAKVVDETAAVGKPTEEFTDGSPRTQRSVLSPTGSPVKVSSQDDEKNELGGDLFVEEKDTHSGQIASSDTLQGEKEQSSGYEVEAETLKDPESENTSGTTNSQEESSLTQEDGGASNCRRSSRHKSR